MEDDEPQLVQNLTETQGIGSVIIGDSIEDSGFYLCQYYGDREYCENFDDDVCSHDGNLWGAGDFGSPYTCTTHYFPAEKYGYEFVEMNYTENKSMLVYKADDIGSFYRLNGNKLECAPMYVDGTFVIEEFGEPESDGNEVVMFEGEERTLKEVDKIAITSLLAGQGEPFEYCVSCEVYVPLSRMPEGDICNKHFYQEE